MYYKVKHFLELQIEAFCRANDIEDSKKIDVIVEYPKDRKLGHFASTIAFTLAKIKKQNPLNIANAIIDFLNQDLKTSEIFSEITSLKGYINFKINISFLNKFLDDTLNDASDFCRASDKNYSILLEYVSANPTGPLHIGHARGAIYGSALQRVGRHLGYDIKGEYYINDAGSQVLMLGNSIYNAIIENDALKNYNFLPIVCEGYKGEYINEVAQMFIDKAGLSYIVEKIQNAGDENSKNLDSLICEIGDFGKNKMLDEIRANLRSLNITFDSFISEKKIYENYDETLQNLKNADAIYDVDGALWLKSTQNGDEKDRVLVRSNGEPTYMMGDVIYHKDKFDRKYNHYINIWGADHHGYIARIKSSLEFLGFDSAKLEILLAQMVSLLKGGKPYKMSKRAGNFILIDDVIKDIGADNLKFIFLSKSLSTHLEFDIDELKKEDASNPVFYINYANARIHTLIKKSNNSNFLDSNLLALKDASAELFDDCMELILLSLNLRHVLNQAFNDRELHKICDYLKNLAKNLHTFYAKYKIIDSNYESVILKIFSLVSLSLATGFKMFGIDIKTSM